MVVRCPYCVRFDHFMTMNVHADRTYVCEKCGHIVIPEDKGFRCSCSHCVALNAFTPLKKRALWLASA
jgi:DNA-directed RNA polymerase subunit RPC12/RpoP